MDIFACKYSAFSLLLLLPLAALGHCLLLYRKEKRKKNISFKIDPKLLMSCNKHLNHGSCGLDRFNQHVTHDYNIDIRNAVPWVSLFNLILLKPTACSG